MFDHNTGNYMQDIEWKQPRTQHTHLDIQPVGLRQYHSETCGIPHQKILQYALKQKLQIEHCIAHNLELRNSRGQTDRYTALERALYSVIAMQPIQKLV